MTTVAVLDTNQKIIELSKELQAEYERLGVASPYFEELWHSLTVCLTELDARLTAGGL